MGFNPSLLSVISVASFCLIYVTPHEDTKTRRHGDTKTRGRTVRELLDAVLDQEAHEAVHPDHTGVGPSHRRVHAALGARVGVIRGEPGDVGARLGMRCVREREERKRILILAHVYVSKMGL